MSWARFVSYTFNKKQKKNKQSVSSYYVGLLVSLQWTLFMQKKYFMISESGEKQEKALNNDKQLKKYFSPK